MNMSSNIFTPNMTMFEDYMGTEIAGANWLIGLIMAIFICLLITRNFNRWKILLLPIMISLYTIGMHQSKVIMTLAGMLFVWTLFGRGITNLMRGVLQEGIIRKTPTKAGRLQREKLKVLKSLSKKEKRKIRKEDKKIGKETKSRATKDFLTRQIIEKDLRDHLIMKKDMKEGYLPSSVLTNMESGISKDETKFNEWQNQFDKIKRLKKEKKERLKEEWKEWERRMKGNKR